MSTRELVERLLEEKNGRPLSWEQIRRRREAYEAGVAAAKRITEKVYGRQKRKRKSRESTP